MGIGPGAEKSYTMLISPRTLTLKEEVKTKINGIYGVVEGQEKIIGCVLPVFTSWRIKPSSYTFTESPLLISNTMLVNIGTKLKDERFRGKGQEKEGRGNGMMYHT